MTATGVYSLSDGAWRVNGKELSDNENRRNSTDFAHER